MDHTRTPDKDQYVELGRQLRVDAIRASAAAGSGHPTSSMSAADLMAVLLAGHLRWNTANPADPGNDHLIFSKGHASPLLYAMLTAAGIVSEEELLTFRKFGSRLEGHPTPKIPFVDVATGSLGQGLPDGAGLAWVGKRLDDLPYRVWVLCGDSELAEGSMWEAFELAGHEKLDNLVAVVDVNRLGQRGPTRHQWDTAAYARRIAAFDWHTIEIDGHDVAAIDAAYNEAAATSGRPTAIIARTRKGSGVAAMEDKEGAHGKPLPHPEDAIEELGGIRHLRIQPAAPAAVQPQGRAPKHDLALPRFEVGGDPVATRAAYGQALAALGDARPDVVALDGEVGDSTFTGLFGERHPERYFECYIAEQQMVAAAIGMQIRGWIPYATTFAAFFTRAQDFVRMAAISRADINLVGTHAGVAIGQDGPSQMALEDLASFRAVQGSQVLYPCDANQTAKLIAAMADRSGIRYLRATRGATPVIYGPDEEFEIGGSRVLRSSDHDEVTLIGAGVTLHEALEAADRLAAEDGIAARVIDLYSIKPVDAATLREAASATGRFVTVEDHWPQGGLGDAVIEAFDNGRPMPTVTRLAVTAMPGSGTPQELLRTAGIDAKAIAAAARNLVRTV